MQTRSPLLGLASIAMAIGFNLPYTILAVIYDYPDILRRPAAEALARFSEAGAPLVLAWHSFAWSALLLVPLSLALALAPANRAISERLALSAAITGVLAGVVQAIGLWRWVFVVPDLARRHKAGNAEVRATAESLFDVLNHWGGVAIGEHLGQWLLVFFVLCLSTIQWRRGMRVSAAFGYLTSLLIAIGTTEGVAIALGRNGDIFSLFTISGFLGLSIWLILTGLGHLGIRARAA